MMQPYFEDEKAGIVLYHGDCRSLLPRLEPGSVDCVIADPPYGIGYQSRRGSEESFVNMIEGDEQVCTDWIVLLRTQIAYVFTRWDVLQLFREALEDAGLVVRDALVWDKVAHGAGDPFKSWAPCYEHILYATRKPEIITPPRPQNVIRIPRLDNGAIGKNSNRRPMHQNQKPVELLAFILGRHESQTVLDPFLGSGTTLVAAKMLGRRGIGIEIDERYCEIAARRIAATPYPLPFTEPAPVAEQASLFT